MRGRRRRLGVVVPARDEAHGLVPCLTALDEAARTARLPLLVVVVLDACRDDSAAVLAGAEARLTARVQVVETDQGSVGAARRLGMERLLDALGADDDWLATTDADSTVPRSWFERQLAYRAAGATLVAGTVRVEDWGTRPSLRPRWERRYASVHRPVHGANLSFKADAYVRCGGFPDVESDEDVALVRAFEREQEAVVWPMDLPVTTSSRTRGRAPHGFAGDLQRLAGEVPIEDSSVGIG